jgi:translation initiation factor 1 (eIF-1/SUI1)
MDKSKRNKPQERVTTAGSEQLTHSPFAKLAAAALDLAPEPLASPPEVSRIPAAPASAKPALRGKILLRRETKRRNGKAVIVVHGFAPESELPDATLEALATELKQTLGCGGTLEHSERGRELVLQGDQPARLAELLRAKGFKVGGVTS